MCDQQQRHDGDDSHRREIFFDVVTELVETGVDRKRRRHKQQRVTIGRLAFHILGGEYGVRTRPVIHQYLLPELIGQRRAYQPRQRIRAAARRKADEQTYGFDGISLRKD